MNFAAKFVIFSFFLDVFGKLSIFAKNFLSLICIKNIKIC